jgi:hypothetical protein
MKRIFLFMFICFVTNGYAQNISYKSVPNSDGVIRCHTMEQDSIRREQDPSLPTIEENEAWLQEKIKVYKKSPAFNNKAGALITIPVIFHVITDLAGAENISAAQVQAQVDQLNIDFRDLAGSPYATAADVDIEFCLAILDPSDNFLVEPGINRVTTYGDGPFSSAFIDGTVKPGTSWDPTNYMNIWSADISGDLLGWAQFPDNSGLGGLSANGGAANTDGVVGLYSSIGSVANPFPGGGPYNLGRTMTHEVGHWLGLRHIWGDGNCGVDDFCSDTPESDASNFGCPNHTSCSTLDMVENYMDYTDDACMNTFTADQKARVLTVMATSPRRIELANSTKCGQPISTIAFANATAAIVNEATDCTFQDFTIDLTISKDPSADATVTVSSSGNSTATLGQDFDLISPVVVFPTGTSANQQITLRVYNDGVVEPNELVELNFNIVTTGDAIATTSANTLNTRTISSNDVEPLGAGSVTILAEDFNAGGLGSFTTQGAAGSDRFLVGNTAAANSAWWNIAATNTTQFAYTNDDNCNCDKANDRLRSPVFSLVGAYTSVTLAFDHAFNGGAGEIGTVQISTGGAYTTVATLTNTSTLAGGFSTTPWVIGETIDLTPYIGQATVQFRFRYNDGGGWRYGMGVDNVVVSGSAPVDIQTIDNTLLPTAVAIKGFETVHYYDDATSDVMMTIENLSSWNYQCTTVDVDRDVTAAGSFSTAFVNGVAADFLASKTFYVSPTANTSTGAYRITLYYTEAEIAGWETETGRLRSDLQIIKVSNNPISSVNSGNYSTYIIDVQNATLGTFGTGGILLTADFNNGFSGFGIGVFQPVDLPVELISFKGVVKESNNELSWETATELNNSHFVLRKSINGIDFVDVIHVNGAGNSSVQQSYKVDDNEFSELDYYQLSQFDFDGSERKSSVISLSRNQKYGVTIKAWPNPTKDGVMISFKENEEKAAIIELLDVTGKTVLRVDKVQGNIYYLDLSNVSQGKYQVRVSNGIVESISIIKL